MYNVILSKRAQKDAKLLKSAKLDNKAKDLLNSIAEDPFKNPPPFEFLVGNMRGALSRRISYHHRLVYYVVEDKKTVHVVRMWSHYE